VSYFYALTQRHLLVLWMGQVLSAIGDQLFIVAAVWLAVQMAGSSAALVAAANFTAALVFGLLGGVYADRLNRRTTMIVVDLIRAAAVLTLPVAYYFGPIQLWHLILVSAAIGAFGAFFDPCLQASLPVLTSDKRMLQATTALMSMTIRIARAVAPSLAGVLAGLVPVQHFFSIDAVSFSVSAISVLALSNKYAWQPLTDRPGQHNLQSSMTELRDAITVVRHHKLLLWSLTTHLSLNILWSIAFFMGAPILVAKSLGNHIGAYGLIVGSFGISGVISTVIIGSISIRRRALFLFAGQIVFGIGLTILGLAKTLPVALLGAALAAPGGPLGDLVLLQIIQADVSQSQFGKVYAFRMMIMTGGIAVGLLISQPLFKFLPASLVITTSAILILLIGVIGFIQFLKDEKLDPISPNSESVNNNLKSRQLE
jgi:MFS transporter, DHA3 family, macrolide efflux protein